MISSLAETNEYTKKLLEGFAQVSNAEAKFEFALDTLDILKAGFTTFKGVSIYQKTTFIQVLHILMTDSDLLKAYEKLDEGKKTDCLNMVQLEQLGNHFFRKPSPKFIELKDWCSEAEKVTNQLSEKSGTTVISSEQIYEELRKTQEETQAADTTATTFSEQIPEEGENEKSDDLKNAIELAYKRGFSSLFQSAEAMFKNFKGNS